jgi:phospholipid transport system substrate-binding protein
LPRFPLFAAALWTVAIAATQEVRAAPADPAVARIETLDKALIETLKDGPTLGPKGRYRKLEPVIEAAFDLPQMTRIAVGPAWSSMSAADQDALVKAFTRLSVASYAHNFDKFGGETFTVDPNVQMRGADKVVKSVLTPGSGAPVNLTYRMRLSGGAWKIIDVYYGAISQLTTRRSDFAGPLASGGAKGLVAHLDSLSEKLLS